MTSNPRARARIRSSHAGSPSRSRQTIMERKHSAVAGQVREIFRSLGVTGMAGGVPRDVQACRCCNRARRQDESRSTSDDIIACSASTCCSLPDITRMNGNDSANFAVLVVSKAKWYM